LLPFDIDRVSISVSKHFRNTWMRKWDWDQLDLREALRESYRTIKTGKDKWQVFIRKKGEKKLVIVYDEETEEVFVITGAEG
jgi:hypothetical protein